MLAGCTGDIGPLRSTPPAAFIILPETESITAARQPRSATTAAETQGVVAAAVVELSRSERDYVLPKGKYVPANEDKFGYYFKAPSDLKLDDMSGSPGGIYWHKGRDRPNQIYIVNDDGVHAGKKISEDLPEEVMIPPKILTPEWKRYLGIDTPSGY